MFDGGLSEAEATRLAEILSANESARQQYIEYVLLHALLQWRGGVRDFTDMNRPPAVETSETAARVPIQPAVPETGLDRAPLPEPTRLAFAAPLGRRFGRLFLGRRGVAALVLLALVPTAIYWLANVRKPKPVAVATVVQSTAARWDGETTSPAIGTGIAPGPMRSLSAGSVELLFGGGARVTIEAPARFATDTAGTMTLESGKLTADVVGPARSFVVNTPSGSITDLGTRFCVNCAAAGGVEVVVIKGRVEVLPRTRGASPTVVTVGQAVKITGGMVVAVPASTGQSPPAHPVSAAATKATPSASVGSTPSPPTTHVVDTDFAKGDFKALGWKASGAWDITTYPGDKNNAGPVARFAARKPAGTLTKTFDRINNPKNLALSLDAGWGWGTPDHSQMLAVMLLDDNGNGYIFLTARAKANWGARSAAGRQQ